MPESSAWSGYGRDSGDDLELLTSHPVHRATPQVHHCQDAYFRWLDGIQHRIGKTSREPAAHRAAENKSCFRIIKNDLDAMLNFLEEFRSETGTF